MRVMRLPRRNALALDRMLTLENEDFWDLAQMNEGERLMSMIGYSLGIGPIDHYIDLNTGKQRALRQSANP